MTKVLNKKKKKDYDTIKIMCYNYAKISYYANNFIKP